MSEREDPQDFQDSMDRLDAMSDRRRHAARHVLAPTEGAEEEEERPTEEGSPEGEQPKSESPPESSEPEAEAPEDPETPATDKPEDPEEDPAPEPEQPPALPEGWRRDDSGAIGTEIDGEFVAADDLRAGYLRTGDYTRKTQQLAEQSRRLEEQRAEESRLTGEILASEDLAAYVAEQPDRLRTLLDHPDQTRRLLRDPETVRRMRESAAAIEADPILRERVDSIAETERAQAALQPQLDESRERMLVGEAAGHVTERLKVVTEEIAAAYPGVDPSKVRERMFTLCGGKNEPFRNIEEMRSVFSSLHQVYMGGSPEVSPAGRQLIEREFRTLQSETQAAESAPAGPQLVPAEAPKKPPPASGPTDPIAAPAPKGPSEDDFDTLHDFLEGMDERIAKRRAG